MEKLSVMGRGKTQPGTRAPCPAPSDVHRHVKLSITCPPTLFCIPSNVLPCSLTEATARSRHVPKLVWNIYHSKPGFPTGGRGETTLQNLITSNLSTGRRKRPTLENLRLQNGVLAVSKDQDPPRQTDRHAARQNTRGPAI